VSKADKATGVKAGKGRKSPASSAAAEREKKSTAGAADKSVPKVGKKGTGSGKRGGALH
jgi:hypothetical protein